MRKHGEKRQSNQVDMLHGGLFLLVLGIVIAEPILRLMITPVLYEVGAAALRGNGYLLLPTILTLLGSCVLRFVWVLTVFQRFGSFEILMNVYLVTWIVTAVLMLTVYFGVRHRVFAGNQVFYSSQLTKKLK